MATGLPVGLLPAVWNTEELLEQGSDALHAAAYYQPLICSLVFL
jgi:hypothetical protein